MGSRAWRKGEEEERADTQRHFFLQGFQGFGGFRARQGLYEEVTSVQLIQSFTPAGLRKSRFSLQLFPLSVRWFSTADSPGRSRQDSELSAAAVTKSTKAKTRRRTHTTQSSTYTHHMLTHCCSYRFHFDTALCIRTYIHPRDNVYHLKGSSQIAPLRA